MPFFKELLDTRGNKDVASPKGEWTKVEAICRCQLLEARRWCVPEVSPGREQRVRLGAARFKDGSRAGEEASVGVEIEYSADAYFQRVLRREKQVTPRGAKRGYDTARQ